MFFDEALSAEISEFVREKMRARLKEDWSRDIRTTMGLGVHGYPNPFTTAVPLAPSAALRNMATCLQQQTEWISACIAHMRERGTSVVEPTAEAEQAWIDHHEVTASATLIARTNSWYLGSNVAGKPGRVLSYTGGVGSYRRKCAEMADAGYQGFAIR